MKEYELVTPTAPWRRSSFCSAGNCVEVAPAGAGVAVRDTKSSSGLLFYTRDEWRAFIDGAKAGEFDDLCV